MPFRIMICNQGIIFLKQLFKETLSLSIYIAADQRHVFSDNTLTHGAHHINLFSNWQRLPKHTTSKSFNGRGRGPIVHTQ